MMADVELSLVKAFPQLFKGYGGNPAETGMAFGLECGKGWHPIIWAMCKALDSHYKSHELNRKYSSYKRHMEFELRDGISKEAVREARKKYVRYNEHKRYIQPLQPMEFFQIKEKFGALCVHHNIADDPVVDGIINMAESMSWVTCEVCGSTEDVHHSCGWIAVRCAECMAIDSMVTTWVPCIKETTEEESHGC
jgi:hypothetical protein